ncbi:hypothetical protein EG329_011287 [Mollisiaceae sp. DMI_Dod_QoI]|nr:hypothetical protein EG329_011287 [Helotiales sp. DMI_Dod_QoI]
MKFILSIGTEGWDKMALLLKDLEWVDGASPASPELQEKYTELGFCDLSVNRRQADDWYCLLRNVQGAEALPEILNGNLKHMIQSVKFLEDRLFCEWAYFVNFEERTFETWGHGTFLEEISFEGLSESDAFKWLDKMQKRDRIEREDCSDEEEEEEEEKENEDEKVSGDVKEDEPTPEEDHADDATTVTQDLQALAIEK